MRRFFCFFCLVAIRSNNSFTLNENSDDDEEEDEEEPVLAGVHARSHELLQTLDAGRTWERVNKTATKEHKMGTTLLCWLADIMRFNLKMLWSPSQGP